MSKLPQNTPCNHHYVPQFYLRNFAIDPEKQKLTTVAKHGHVAVWAKRSIKSLGYERDLYVSLRNGVPVSVETIINERIETPISESDTWQKIASGRSDALDETDCAATIRVRFSVNQDETLRRGCDVGRA